MKNISNESFARIKLSLESYEEQYIPGSWENFQQKRKSRRRIIFLRIAAGVAASLLFLIAGTNYFYFEKKNALTTPVEQITNLKKDAILPEQPEASKTVAAMVSPEPAAVITKEAGEKSTVVPVPQNSVMADGTSQVSARMADTTSGNRAVQAGNTLQAAVLTNPGQSGTDTTGTRKDTVKALPASTLPGNRTLADNQTPTTGSKRKVRFGVNFSPGVSTAQTSGSFNYTGGLSADIPLTSNIGLTTGLQVENQSIVRNLPGIASSSVTPQNQSKTKVTNLDVPVNFKWKIFSEKSRAYYVSAGLSSLVYLWQLDKNTTYSQDLIPVSSLVSGQEILSYKVVDQVSVIQDAGTPEQTFDLAGRVNIMVGFETKLTNKFLIHIEPYAKIPTSGQAPASLNHTSTGINFKISF
jgi:Tfp pilus assembly major pilin PilA